MEQEHRITYKAGITRTPSDFLCQDGELAECINLATDNEELKPVVQPVAVADTFTPIAPILQGFHLLYVHKFNDDERYIGYTYDTAYHANYLCYATKDGTELTYRELQAPYTETTKVTSIGKTLIVSDANGVNYFLWETTTIDGEPVPSYENLGPIPDPNLDFWLEGGGEDFEPLLRAEQYTQEFDYYVYNRGAKEGIVGGNSSGYVSISENGEASEEYNNLVIGLYSKNKKAIAEKKCFSNPFFIRYALEMYDGSYTYISEPILMLPSVSKNTFAVLYEKNGYGNCMMMFTKYCRLHYDMNSNGLEKFSDVIKNVVLFVSRSIDVYDTLVDQKAKGYGNGGLVKTEDHIDYFSPDGGSKVFADGIYRKDNADYSSYNEASTIYSCTSTGSIVLPVWEKFEALMSKPKKDLEHQLKTTSTFYKLCELGLKSSSGDVGEKIEAHTLENIEVQETLESDDFYSRSKLVPKYIYAYNSRLNIANVSRGMFEGYGFFMPFDNSTASIYDFYVRIKTDTESVWVRHQVSTKQKQGIYFYYPDSRADRVTIYKGNTCVCDKELIEHPGLNGAYYLKGLPGIDVDETTVSVDPIEGFDPNRTMPDINNKYNNDYLESLPNYIIQSDVNNPWVFPAKGYHKVGTGKIIGMSTITQALSQGQFGQYPLLVFSESGIWAMSVNNTGLYQSIQPMSRDVCLNPNSILQTDGTVFFVSKKGLMVIVGNEVRCVSELMNGRAFNTAVLSPLATGTDWAGIVSACQGETTFLEYIRDDATFMSYDYIDSRIIITRPGAGFSFAYNIADGTISKVILPAAMTGAVNNYPDYLLQGTVTVEGTTQNRLYSYYEKPREENVAERQLGFVLTRPMKLAGPVSQASLRQLMNVGTWRKKDAQGNELSCVKTEIYLSEDMQTWFPDISRYGAAARYYRLALFIKMLPTERLSGTILTEQERRAHNMR